MIAYPPAPWRLGGWGVASIGLVDRAAAAQFVPAGAHIVNVAPGKTIGGVFFLAYDTGSLVYRELNVVAGLVRIGMRLAFVLPRLYVDSRASLAGGHEIWGVPKELAAFEVARDGGMTSIDVRQGSRQVCRITSTASAAGLRVGVPLPSFGLRDEAFLLFTGKLHAKMSFVHADVELPVNSEFAALRLDRPRVALRCDDLTLAVPAPRSVSRFSYRRRKNRLAEQSVEAKWDVMGCNRTCPFFKRSRVEHE